MYFFIAMPIWLFNIYAALKLKKNANFYCSVFVFMPSSRQIKKPRNGKAKVTRSLSNWFQFNGKMKIKLLDQGKR